MHTEMFYLSMAALVCLMQVIAVIASDQRHNRIHGGVSRSLLQPTSSQTIPVRRPSIGANRNPSFNSPDRDIQVKTKRRNDESPQRTGMKTLYATPAISHSYEMKPTTTSNGTVDIFFYLEFDKAWKASRKEYFWVNAQVAAMMSPSVNEVRVHILSTSINILEKASSLGFYAHDLSYQLAIHASLNSRIERTVCNERNAMATLRWKAFHDIVAEWNSVASESPIQRIVVIEDDVLMAVSSISLFDRAMTSSSTEVVNLAGAAALSSPAGLTAFSTFIDDWYNGTIAEIKAKCNQDGGISDIGLFDRFVRLDPTVRYAWSSSDATGTTSAGAGTGANVAALQCAFQESFHNPRDTFFGHQGRELRGRVNFSVKSSPLDATVTVRSPAAKLPYCFMRFKDKGIMYAYGRALEILYQGEEARSPSAVDNLSGDLLLVPEGSKEIYYVHSNNTRYLIPTMEDFLRRFHTHDDLIYNVPSALIAAFNPSPEPVTYPWQNGEVIQFTDSRDIFYFVVNGQLCPIAGARAFTRLKLRLEDVKKIPAYSGVAYRILPFGPAIN